MTTYKTYGIESKPYEKLSKKAKIFYALYKGRHLAPNESMTDIFSFVSSDATRHIRQIRNEGNPVVTISHPMKEGGRYYEYYFTPEHIEEIQKQLKSI